jgi:prepilin peptidase CpaA
LPVEILTPVALVLTMALATVYDIRTRRIPNWLTFGALGVALLLRLVTGVHPFLQGLGGAGLGFILGIFFMMLGAWGGGDGKLLMAAGAFFGLRGSVGAFLLMGVLGGLLALEEAIRQGAILPVLYNIVGSLRRLVTFGRRGAPLPTLESAGAVKVPYGVAIALGAVIWWFWGVPLI